MVDMFSPAFQAMRFPFWSIRQLLSLLLAAAMLVPAVYAQTPDTEPAPAAQTLHSTETRFYDDLLTTDKLSARLIITEEDQQEAHVMLEVEGDLIDCTNNITHDTYCLHAVFVPATYGNPPDETGIATTLSHNGSSLRLQQPAQLMEHIQSEQPFELYVLLRNNGYASFTFDPSIHLPPPETDDEPASHGLDEDTP